MSAYSFLTKVASRAKKLSAMSKPALINELAKDKPVHGSRKFLSRGELVEELLIIEFEKTADKIDTTLSVAPHAPECALNAGGHYRIGVISSCNCWRKDL